MGGSSDTTKLKKSPIAQLTSKTLPSIASTYNVAHTAPERQTAPVSGNVEQIVRQAARKYGINEDYFVHIAQCESGLNPNAVNYSYNENGYPSGLFQHLSGYYPARAAKYGYSSNVFDAYSNANTTAAMFADGLQYLWECN